MEDLFRDFWWLMFPIGFFVMGAVGTAMRAGMQRDRLETLRAYADKGMTPPPELTREAPVDYRDWRHERRMARRYYRARWWGRGWFVPAVLSAVFISIAMDRPDSGSHDAFLLVGVVLGAVALGSALMAIPLWFAPPKASIGGEQR